MRELGIAAIAGIVVLVILLIQTVRHNDKRDGPDFW